MNSGFTADLRIARIALDIPIAPWFDYRIGPALAESLAVGDWVQVPWGSGRRIGLVLERRADSELAPDRLKDIEARLDEAPALPATWFALLRFAAGYYHRSVGEFAWLAVPRTLRTPASPRARSTPFARARRTGRTLATALGESPPALSRSAAGQPLWADQQQVLNALIDA
ncbi:MAG: hypothetical protein ACKODG_11950, partial [Betaproteobacteria bacterium]